MAAMQSVSKALILVRDSPVLHAWMQKRSAVRHGWLAWQTAPPPREMAVISGSESPEDYSLHHGLLYRLQQQQMQ
jgi:hypothetical protein